MLRSRLSLLLISCSLVAGARLAAAQPAEGGQEEEGTARAAYVPGSIFVELAGNWGLQIGTQSYVPNGTPFASKQPLTNGLGFGAAGGYSITKDFQLLVDYNHGDASSRTGNVTGALSAVDGSITYDAIAAGARLGHRLGAGRVYGELGIGMILPFSTKVTYEYASTVTPLGIMGVGTEEERYNAGVGALAEFGYHVPIASGFYLGASLRLAAYQTSNDGQATSLTNFVTDWSSPYPVTMDIHHGTDTAATPQNYSVQDARFHIALGHDF